jgi:replicative DNA helicase
MSDQANKPAEREQRSSTPPTDDVPHSAQTEQSLLGAILLDGAAMDRVAGLINEEDFYIDAHRVIFRACLQLANSGHPVDQITVYDRIESEGRATRVGGFSYVASLAGQTPSVANVQKYAEIVREKSVRRLTIAKGQDLIAAAGSRDGRSVMEVIQQGENDLVGLAEMTNRGEADFKRGQTVILGVVERLDHLYNNPPENGIVGIATGVTELDVLTSGLQPALYILAGRPAMGKTALAMNIAEHIAIEEKLPVAIFSMEMEAEQLMQRMLGSVGRIDQSRMRNAQFDDADWAKVTHSVVKMNDTDIYICDKPSLSTLDIRARARKLLKKVGKLGVIVIDYLQLMQSATPNRNANRAEVVGEFSRTLKILSGELGVPIIALSQLNRAVEQRPNKRPTMADLRESGSLEQDADVIMFVYRDEVYHPDSPDKGTAELIIGKNRHGPLDVIQLEFKGQYTRFENMVGYRRQSDTGD